MMRFNIMQTLLKDCDEDRARISVLNCMICLSQVLEQRDVKALKYIDFKVELYIFLVNISNITSLVRGGED